MLRQWRKLLPRFLAAMPSRRAGSQTSIVKLAVSLRVSFQLPGESRCSFNRIFDFDNLLGSFRFNPRYLPWTRLRRT